MQSSIPADLAAQARKSLLNIVSILKEGSAEEAVKALVFGLAVYIKHNALLIKHEKKEFQELFTKAAQLISLDRVVKEVCDPPLHYTPGQEQVLLGRLLALPEAMKAVQSKGEVEREATLEREKAERLEKGKALLAQKYYDGALAHFTRLVGDYPADAALTAEIGKLLYDINHIECITFFEKAVALDPKDHGTLALMGVALRKTRKFEQAEAAYLKALELSPDNVGYLFNLSRVYIDAGNWQKAQQTLRCVLELSPGLEPAEQALEFASRHCRDML